MARVVTQYLEDNKIGVLDWPAVLQDLSSIEHLWDEMERRLRRRPNQSDNLVELEGCQQGILEEAPRGFVLEE